MTLRHPDDFPSEGLVPICRASRFKDTKAVEQALDRAGVEYTIEITRLSRPTIMGVLFGARTKGVTFLVTQKDAGYCLEQMERAGLSHLFVTE